MQRLLTRPAEAKAAITQVFTSRMQQLGHLGGDFTKGALKENIEETADGLVSAIAKAVGTGHSVQQAVGDYIKQIPENAIVTSLVGGGGEAIPAAGESTVRRPPGQTAATPPALPPAPQQHSAAAVAAPASQHPIPDATTPNTTGSDQQPSTTANDRQPSQPLPSGSGQQQSTTVNNSQPSSTPPAALPVPTFEEAGTAKETIDKLKAQEGPLNAEQQKELDGAERTFARRTEDNILKQQAGIEKRGGKLHPTTAKALEAARATLARPRPEENTDSVGTPDKTTSSTASSSGPLPPADTATTQGVTPPAGTSSVDGAPPAETSSASARTPGSPSQPPATDSQPSQPSIPPSTTKSEPGSGQPPQTIPSRVPTFEEAIAARNTADKLKAQKAPLSPDQQQTLDAAEKTFARRTEYNILNQQAGIEKRGGKLHPTTAKALADAQAILAQPTPQSVTRSGDNTARPNPSAANAHPPGAKGSVPDEPRLSNATPSHAPAIPKSMPGEGSQTGGKTLEQSLTPQQGQPPVAPKVSFSSSAPKLTPEQQANIPHITQTAKTLLTKLTAAHASQFQNLKNPVSESADACDVTQSGMWLNEDYSVGYHLPTLAAEMAIHNDHAIPGHIETRFNNLLQASPEYNFPVQKPAPQQISQSGTQSGIDSPNTFATVETGIKPHLKEWGRIDGEIHQWKGDFQRAARTKDTLAMDRIKTNIDALEVQRQGLVDQVHRLLEMPSGMRIPFAFADLTPTTRTAAIRGAALAERYIHPDLLPKMGAVDFNSKRAGQFRGMLLIHRLSDPSSVLHEIAHGVEEKSPNVLAKCIDFLKKRAGNEKPQQLALLTGNKVYTSDEVAYEDEFASRGGSHYMGKLYPNGTEILTMGIERLHADPIEFYVNDPEYFAFVINTLQHP